MRAIRYQQFDALLPDGDAMLRLAEQFGSYGMYGEESIEDDFGEGLAQLDHNRLGPYRIIKELGRGGQGIVHLAEDTRLSRKVALKVITGLGP